jgi:hypothetical protein
LEKLVGLKHLAFHANIFQIDGGGLSRGSLYNFLVVSGIEACLRLVFTRHGSNRNGEPNWPCGRASSLPIPNS